jgi:hypothetical protein
MIEHLLDEALVNAVRRGDTALSWKDVERRAWSRRSASARRSTTPTTSGGSSRPTRPGTRRRPGCSRRSGRLEVLTIVKRRGSLGLLRTATARTSSPAPGRRSGRSSRSPGRPVRRGGLLRRRLDRTGGDLLYATNAAAEMVGRPRHGPSLLSYAAITNSSFSDTNLVGGCSRNDRGRDAVERLLQELKQEARVLVEDSRHLVEALRDALLEREELVGAEITDVLEAAAASPRVVDLTDGSVTLAG